MPKTLKPEAALQKCVMELLSLHHVEHFRMNSGMLRGAGGRPVRFGLKGMADILTFPIIDRRPHPVWIELKAPGGSLSAEQEQFRERMLTQGHGYLVIQEVGVMEMHLKGWELLRG